MVIEWLRFTNTPTTPGGVKDETLISCIGLTGAYNQVYGGPVIQIGKDGTCHLLSNDGETDGTFIIYGGQGFRGRGEMGLGELVGSAVWVPSGGVTSLTLDGIAVPTPYTWDVPVDRDSTQLLAVSFDSGLSFEIRIDVKYNPSGLNTVTHTITNARRRV